MQMYGNTIVDSTFKLYDLTSESLNLKDGNCAVYIVTRNKDLQVLLPKASDCYGSFVFVYLTSTYYVSATDCGSVSVVARSVDFIGVDATTSVSLTEAGHFILLYSSGICWLDMVHNY